MASETDLTFFSDGELALQARHYRPDGAGPFPLVVDVHGGAWTTNDRTANAAIARAFAADGIAVLALDFRMPPVARYPVTVADVNLGIRWAKAHAAELGTTPERVGGLGTSSGGHLLLLNALRPRDPRFAALPLPEAPQLDASLAFAIVAWPVSDPSARYAMARERGVQMLLDAHHAFWRDVDEMDEGNPRLILEHGHATATPPLLVIQGTNDANLTPDMQQLLVAAYERAGGSARLELFENEPHSFVTKDATTANARRALGAMAAFVHEHARGTAPVG